MSRDVVATELVGAVWPAAEPGEDPVLYGHVALEPKGAFQARSLQTFRMVYTVGRYGIDDTGSIRIVFRFMGDWGDFQTVNPTAYNYVSATCSNPTSQVVVSYGKTAHQRPFFRAVTVRLKGGYLKEGDTITVVFGDTSGGSPGMQLQTMAEAGFEFKVLADVCATGHYVPLPESPYISVVPGPAHTWRAVLPSLRRPGESFRLGIKAEDMWGNPTDLASGNFSLEASLPVDGLPESLAYETGTKSLAIDNLQCTETGVLHIRLVRDGQCVATAGPLVIRDGQFSGYWGDLHGQSGESIGITTSEQYFDFARNKAFLDVTGHQANDFQVNNAFWRYLNELTAQYHEDGRFVVFPGYEWSGNTAVGGDRNVFFRHEGRQIHRSSHALITDRSDIATDAPNAAKLFEMLADEDCVVYAHVGGRYADPAQAHDPKLETAMEIHSAWGTFEWLLTDGFKLGHRCGVVCNSDGHKGRPGASYPGAATFGAYGGLTCFLTDDLSRDGIFECLRRRHHYGTTGCRMHMDVQVSLPAPGALYERDPDAFDNPASDQVSQVMMGDIVRSDAQQASLSLEVIAHAPIHKIEVRNGTQVIKTLHPYTDAQLGNRIRVVWSGAEYRGRGRQTAWIGKVRFAGFEIDRISKINAWNHERLLAQNGADTVEFNAITTGNFGGFDAWINPAAGAATGNGELIVHTNHGEVRMPMDDIGMDERVTDLGGLERQLRICRLPEQSDGVEMRTTLDIPLQSTGDNPLWICVTTEDGFQAWSSPVFVIR